MGFASLSDGQSVPTKTNVTATVAQQRCATSLLAKCLSLMMLVVSFCASKAQSNEWEWMGGSTTEGALGVYGTKGTPAPQNVPGSRSQPVTWTDQKGNLWLFGGYGFYSSGAYGYLNDLWKFNPSTNEWTWIGGSNTLSEYYGEAGVYGTLGTPAATNIPSSRFGAVGWTDAKGNLWLFGGSGYNAGTGQLEYFNDLWEFNPSTAEWTWMGGSQLQDQSGQYGTLGTPAIANAPGARGNANGVTDGKGNLWLFGGAGYASGSAQGNLNDLWMFNPGTDEWTWVSGANVVNQAAVAGTLRTPAAGNVPASRNGAASWIDSGGDIWIFGGIGIGSPGAGVGSSLNDLWEFNPVTGEWAWMSGIPSAVTFAVGHPGIYGTLQSPNAENVPGDRTGAMSWIDSKGNLWMFGGNGYDSADTDAVLNDLWEFLPSVGQWAWMSGADVVPTTCGSTDSFCGQLSTYGISQSPGLGDAPGGRYDSASWTDGKGNFWIFGGIGLDVQDDYGPLDDLWEFQPNTGASAVTATPDISPGSGAYTSWQTVTITDATPGATISYTINGGTPAQAYTAPITVSSSETIEAIASASGDANSNISTAAYVEDLTQTAAPTFSIGPGTYATSQTVTISDTTPGATIYYAIGATPTTDSAVYSGGAITISVPETLEAIAVADNYAVSTVTTAAYNIGPNPSATWTWMGGSKTIPATCPSPGSCGPAGWYGTYQTFAAENLPIPRKGGVTWTDGNGDLWLFGGQGNQGALNDLWEYKPSIGQWAWMAGSSTIASSHPGIYGTLGTAAAANTPGSRANAVGWSDAKGNLWLFGGYGVDANNESDPLDDLWKFNTSTNEWTWMGGYSNLNCAGGICFGRPGVYGTLGKPAPTNIPGGRSAATGWIDRNGNLWMYGGFGVDSAGIQCYLDDLWEFSPTTNEWIWVSGSQFASNADAGYPGVYGAVGVPAAGNNPWSLVYASSWIDRSDHLWLFGGIGEDPTSAGYTLNDMWEFYPSIGEWAFTNANSIDGPGGSGFATYGTLGDWSPANFPGERTTASSWTDSEGDFWMFGGSGLTSSFPTGMLNDLWEFKPSLNEWAWIGGSDTLACLIETNGVCASNGQPGTYGTLGTPSPGNIPGGRVSAATWTDSRGNLWIFGGSGFDAQGNQGYLNDLWQYSLTGSLTGVAPVPEAAAPTFSLAAGTYTSAQPLTISEQTPGATIYYTTNGTTPTSSSAVYSAPLTISSSETVEAIAVASNYSVSPLAIEAYTMSIPQAATPTYSVPAGTYNSTQTVTISDATTGAVIYYTTDGTTPTSSSTVYSTAIRVSTSETLSAIAEATGYTNSVVASAAYTITPPPTFTLQANPSSITVSPGGQGATTLTVTPEYGFNSTVSFTCSGLPARATCSFSTTSVTTTGAAASSVLTISASSQSAFWVPSSRSDLRGVMVAAAVIIFGVRRRRLKHATMLAVACAGLQIAAGCGGASTGSSGPGPVTTSVTIVATAGAIRQTASVSLTVK